MTWDRFTYYFGELDEGVKADYTAWLKSRALMEPLQMRNSLRRPDGSLDEMEFRYAKERVQDNITSLQYDWGGPLSAKSLASQPGMVKLLHLLSQGGIEEGTPQSQPVCMEEIEALVFAKHQAAIEACRNTEIDPDEANEVSVLLKQIMEDAIPKGRAQALKKIREARARRAQKDNS